MAASRVRKVGKIRSVNLRARFSRTSSATSGNFFFRRETTDSSVGTRLQTAVLVLRRLVAAQLQVVCEPVGELARADQVNLAGDEEVHLAPEDGQPLHGLAHEARVVLEVKAVMVELAGGFDNPAAAGRGEHEQPAPAKPREDVLGQDRLGVGQEEEVPQPV